MPQANPPVFGVRVQIELPHLAERPTARKRVALSPFDLVSVAGLPSLLMGDVEVASEHVDDLVVVVVDNCLRQRDQVGAKRPQTIDEHGASSSPVSPSPPQVLRHHTHESKSGTQSLLLVSASALANSCFCS